jgi:hypothetical protein
MLIQRGRQMSAPRIPVFAYLFFLAAKQGLFFVFVNASAEHCAGTFQKHRGRSM